MVYVLQTGNEGAQRLRLLARVKWPTTRRLLQRVGLTEGMRCLDVGCGIGEVTRQLARWTGPRGQAVGLDANDGFIALAQEEAQREGLPALFRTSRANELAVDGSFDLVFTRFTLTHLPEPAQAVERMLKAVRPGGALVFEDVDFAGHFCHPACPAFDRYVALYQEVVRRNGGDACIGPRLLGLALDAGLHGVQLEVVQPAFYEGEGKRVASVTMAQIGPAVTKANLATPDEVAQIVAELDAFAAQPRSIVSLPRIFQVWGRRH